MSPAQYRKERTQRGLTQAALAALLGVPREAVVRREAGTQPIIAEAALALLSLAKTKPPKPGKPNNQEEQITLARADARRDMAAFLSYAVGCMMGRYSPDHPGLILADAGASLPDFLAKVGRPLEALTFAPDEDGIIPVLDGEWFEDDIVARTRDFLRATFGDDTLNENLRFIEESLGKDLRKYFQTDFYKNHIQTYKKRPIYWLVRSPKGAFAELVYLHRMTRDIRNYLVKLRARIEHLDHAQAVATTAKDKTTARKESDQLKKNLRECEEWERDVLLPLAQSRPEHQ